MGRPPAVAAAGVVAYMMLRGPAAPEKVTIESIAVLLLQELSAGLVDAWVLVAE